MSLINQVLKDIEQRQASLQLEDSNIKTKLHPALGVVQDDWRLPRWLKPFLFLCVVVALIYHFWPNITSINFANFNFKAQTSSAVNDGNAENQDARVHYLLTKTLSSDWQAWADKKETQAKRADKNSQKTPNKDLDSNAANVNKPNLEEKRTVLESSTTASKQDVAGDASVNFTSSVTPVAGVEAVQVLKQMKPEQEANQNLQRAIDMHQKGNITEAIDATRKALALAPQSEDARQLLAGYLVESKQSQEAILVLQSGLQLQPKQLGLRKALAKLQLSEGQQDKALETLQQGAEQAPRDGDYSAFWALTLQKANKHSAAVPLFEQALRTNPSQVQWLVGYAVSLQAEGRTQEALKQFQEAQNLPATERLSMFIQQRIQQLQNP